MIALRRRQAWLVADLYLHHHPRCYQERRALYSTQPEGPSPQSEPRDPPSPKVLLRITASRRRFNEALEELNRQRQRNGIFDRMDRLINGSRAVEERLSKEGDKEGQDEGQDERGFFRSKLEIGPTSDPVKVKHSPGHWDFAHQRLVFPTDASWPPRLPGVVASYPATPGSPTWKRPSLAKADYAIPDHRPPRDMAALALEVHRHALPPRSQEEIIDGIRHITWRPGLGTVGCETSEELLWASEKLNRLEYLGDAIAREIAVRIVFSFFPDITPGGLNTLSSHLTTNDTFSYLYNLAGIEEMRHSLAMELLKEAVQRDIKRLQLDDAKIEHHYDTVLSNLEASAKADRFEAYLAYIRLAHGSEVAEEWFATLIQPWVDRIANHPVFPPERSLTTAGLLRRRVQEERAAAEEKKRHAAKEKRFASFGALAVASRKMLRRFIDRDRGSSSRGGPGSGSGDG